MQSGLASATALLLSASESRAVAQAGKGRKVIVVGGGFSGLACAYELSSAGCDVTVLEASNRLSGRVRSIKDFLPGTVVEAGGEFLGANHPTVQAYAARFGLELREGADDEAENPEPCLLDGRLLTKDELKAAEADADQAYSLLTDAAKPVVPERAWQTPNALELDRTSTSDWLNRLNISPLAKRLVGTQLTIDNAAALPQQSLLGNLAQIRGGGLERYWTDTELYRCKGGNQQFATKLAEGIGADQIKLNKPVSRIHIGQAEVVVTDASGKQYKADDVVLTAPPSVWNRIEFEPALPPGLTPQMGSAVKFLSRVRGSFWKKRGLPPAALSNGGTGSLWWGTENQKHADAREVLVGFIGGPAATAWSKRPADARLKEYPQQLEALQPGFSQALEEIRFVNWIAKPWIAAGYSFPAPGQVTSQGPTLFDGLGRLHFAGEYTSYQFIGYIEGALNSGAALAKRLVAA